jgi:hypothetical protein
MLWMVEFVVFEARSSGDVPVSRAYRTSLVWTNSRDIRDSAESSTGFPYPDHHVIMIQSSWCRRWCLNSKCPGHLQVNWDWWRTNPLPKFMYPTSSDVIQTQAQATKKRKHRHKRRPFSFTSCTNPQDSPQNLLITTHYSAFLLQCPLATLWSSLYNG